MATQQISVGRPFFGAQSPPNKHTSFPAKHKAFVQAYLATLNATQAAITAGYSHKSAHAIGNRLLKHVRVRSAIDAELEKRSELAGITATYVLHSVRAIADDPVTRKADKLTALTLLGKNLKLWTDTMEVNVTHDLADRVAQARQRVAPRLVATEVTSDD